MWCVAKEYAQIAAIKSSCCNLATMTDTNAAIPASKRRVVSPGAGKVKYGEELNFELGCTDSQGSHVIVTSKLCHLHPPAGIVSRTRIVVSEDVSSAINVQGRWQLTTTAKFLVLCERITSSQYKFCPGIDPEVNTSK